MTDPFIMPAGNDPATSWLGKNARPLSILLPSAGAAIATVLIAAKVSTFGEGAIFIAAVFTGVAALYTAKSWENSQAGKHAASVEVAKAAGPVQP